MVLQIIHIAYALSVDFSIATVTYNPSRLERCSVSLTLPVHICIFSLL